MEGDIEELGRWRKRLDEIDRQIVNLLNQRMHVAYAIAQCKAHEHMAIEDNRREADVVAHAEKEATHFVLKEMIGQIYKPIMACSKASQALHLMQNCPFSHVGIIGLGLIGGSIAKVLKAKDSKINVYTVDSPSPDIAKAYAEVHDKQAAYVSHLPGVISEMFYRFVIDNASESISMAGPGFASMTRLAHDNALLRKEILSENHVAFTACFNQWIHYMNEKR